MASAVELLTSQTRKVWIPDHPKYAYFPGQVDEAADDGKLLVVDEHGGKFWIPQAEAQSVDAASLEGVEDLLMLGDFSEAALLHNVRVRYGEDKIYTCIGAPILISVNPYQKIPGLYSDDKQRQYRQAGAPEPGRPCALPIHLYTVADAAYKVMLQDQSNQSIIISGESGAGKTEATKCILAYLAEMQRSTFRPDPDLPIDSPRRRTVEQQILDANPVLEAFGNAKTARNDNSSRFGKFVEVEFDVTGRLLSAQVSNYLLEKCRIVTQQPDERNYHIFYHLCSGATTDVADFPEALHLSASSDFEYTKSCDAIAGVDDREELRQVLKCMHCLGFSVEDRNAALQIVAGVLHLGNLEFTACSREGQDTVALGDVARAATISKLFGIEVQQLQNVFEYKTLEDPLTKKTIHQPHNMRSASYVRHSMAKVAYARLFDWLVWRINESISMHGKPKKDVRRIGLLDIYGFEVFDMNSFEQLCINFANEKLQQHFNKHMFTLEQDLYSNEGIAWNHISFQDNQHIIDHLDRKPLGIFHLVDSECLMPNASDNSLLGKIHSSYKSSKVVYKPTKFASNDFAMAHYAGEVVYNVETFLDKNMDKLHVDVVNLFKTSSLELLQKLFTDARFTPELTQKIGNDTARAGRSTNRKSRSAAITDTERQRQNVTVSMMFREQLDRLVEDLNKTNPRYVRCIKPNLCKQPREFDSHDVLRQLRSAGMLESIRIRRAGYAVRRPFKEFFQRFRLLFPHLAAVGNDPDYRGLCQRLATEVQERLQRDGLVLDEKTWQLGQTRIFMKEELERHFERLLVESARTFVVTLQRRWRGYKAKKHYRALQENAMIIQGSVRTFRIMKEYAALRLRNRAALAVQAAFRSKYATFALRGKRRAAVCIQRHARGWRCRLRIPNLKSKAAAAKIDKLREEEDRLAALRKAKLEAEEQRAANLDTSTQLIKLQEENKNLLARLNTKADGASSNSVPDPEHQASETAQVADLLAEVARLQGINQTLEGDLERAKASSKVIAEQKSDHLRSPDGRRTDKQESLGALSSELPVVVRITPSSAPGTPGSQSPSPHTGIGTHHTIASSLRPIGESGTLMLPAEHDRPMLDRASLMPASGRNTLMNNREVFEQLKRAFSEKQGVTQQPEFPGMGVDAPDDGFELRSLEDRVRSLQMENSELKTKLLSAEEEAVERGGEAHNLLHRVSTLEAELEDQKFRNKHEVSALRRELADSITLQQQQIEDITRLNARALEAEDLARSMRSGRRPDEWNELDRQISVLEKQRAEAESRLSAMAEELTRTHRERDKVQGDFRAKENELANIKRLLDDALSAHAPMEDLRKAKVEAETYKQQYYQAMRYNKEMTTAVGSMTRAASERGGDVSELQQRNLLLQREHEKKEQEIKMVQLEKQDLQKQVENLQSSGNYFQNKYKSTTELLKIAEREKATVVENLSKERARVLEAHRECELHRNHLTMLRQQQAEAHEKIQDSSVRMQVVSECLDTLAALHDEQIRVCEDAYGRAHDAALQQAIAQKREKASGVVARVKALIAAAGEGSSSPGGMLATSLVPQPHPDKTVLEVAHSAGHEGGRNVAVEGRASLLTQLNLSEFRAAIGK